jgi:hypothetical protein
MNFLVNAYIPIQDDIVEGPEQNFTMIDLLLTACSFRWIIVAESTVRWFVVREKYCWMAADSAE